MIKFKTAHKNSPAWNVSVGITIRILVRFNYILGSLATQAQLYESFIFKLSISAYENNFEDAKQNYKMYLIKYVINFGDYSKHVE